MSEPLFVLHHSVDHYITLTWLAARLCALDPSDKVCQLIGAQFCGFSRLLDNKTVQPYRAFGPSALGILVILLDAHDKNSG
jgi:hypothetical protein